MGKDIIKIIEQTKANIETEYGNFKIIAYKMSDNKTHIALIKEGNSIPLLRIQSHCLFGTAFHSLMCDCGYQIDKSLKYLSSTEHGIMFYLDQEGRGYGLYSKVEILSQMNNGLSLNESQEVLNRKKDLREYGFIKLMLDDLKIEKVDILVGSLKRAETLKKYGLPIRNVIIL